MKWIQTSANYVNSYRWDGPSIHDLNDDYYPEIISRGDVFDGRTGNRLNPTQFIPSGWSSSDTGTIPVIDDFDQDGIVDGAIGAGGIYSWNSATNLWYVKYPNVPACGNYGFADFGRYCIRFSLLMLKAGMERLGRVCSTESQKSSA